MSKLNQRLTGVAAACLVVVGGIAFAQTDASQGKGSSGTDTQQGALQRPAQPADLPPATTSSTTTSTDTTMPSSTSTPSSSMNSTPASSSTTTTTTTTTPSSSDTATPAPRSDRG